jgi:hypothetical protein
MLKKPWVKLKVEKYIYAPATDQSQGLERVYRGFAKLGHRVESAALGMGKNLDGVIRAAGVEAVAAVEEIRLRFIKCFGCSPSRCSPSRCSPPTCCRSQPSASASRSAEGSLESTTICVLRKRISFTSFSP